MSGETIEQLAKKLEHDFSDNKYYDLDGNPDVLFWVELSKYVYRMIIEARIDELHRVYGGSAESNLAGQHNRIAELSKELENI